MPLGILIVAGLLAAAPVEPAAPSSEPAAAPAEAGAASASLAASAAPRTRIAIVPFENVTRAGGARATVMETMAATLAAKGFDVVPDEEVEGWLHARRVRYLDSLPTDQLGELLATLGADAALVGTVLAWRDDEKDPEVAVAARLLTPTGTVLWSDVGGLTGAETAGALGLSQAVSIRGVADRLVLTLLDALPPIHLRDVPAPAPTLPRTLSPPIAFRSREPLPQLPIAILPLQNFGTEHDAPRIVEAVLLDRLDRHASLRAIPPADLRRAVVAAGLRAPGQLSLDQLKALGKGLGTTLFVRGTILAFGTTTSTDGGETPEVELYVSLLDAESGRTLWSGLHRRTGLDYEGLLQLGAARDATSVARRVVAELLDAFTRP
jgi:hypothetical protein